MVDLCEKAGVSSPFPSPSGAGMGHMLDNAGRTHLAAEQYKKNRDWV